MSRTLFPNDYIQEVLIDEVQEITLTHPYISFFLVCAGIEFLGICLDDTSTWFSVGKSEAHFKKALDKLFPAHYSQLKNTLYSNLRCGLLHCMLPKDYSLGELKDTPNLKYSEHLISNNKLIIIDYFYKDFVNACKEVLNMTFPQTSKMHRSVLRID